MEIVALLIIIVCIYIIYRIHLDRKFQKTMATIKYEFGKKPKNEYLKISDINNYSIQMKTSKNQVHYIDSITWNDLNMDLVYKRINSCKSKIGMEYLYCKLHEISLDNAENSLYSMIDYYNNNMNLVFDIQYELNNINKNSISIVPLFSPKANNTLPFPDWLYNTLAILPLAASILLAASFILSFSPLIPIILIISLFTADIVIHYKTKTMLNSRLEIVDQLCSTLNVGNKLIKSNLLQENDEYCKFKESLNKLKDIRPSLGSQSKGIMAEMSFLLEYINILFMIDIRKYKKSMAIIKDNLKSLKQIYKYIGILDSAICILSYRKSLDFYCIPTAHNENNISFKDIYHPLIGKPVLNDFEINNNIIITGANATGKSTFIKSIAINNIFAHTINTCLASQYITKPMFTITSMALRDDITSGESYYVTEIKSLKRILDKINELPCLCLIDEILRGTNTIERISASLSVLKYIQDKNCFCIVATHDAELAQRLDNQFSNYHFDEKVTDNSIEFNYKIKTGIANSKNAIKLLSFYNYDKEIIDEANRLVLDFED